MYVQIYIGQTEKGFGVKIIQNIEEQNLDFKFISITIYPINLTYLNAICLTLMCSSHCHYLLLADINC